MRCRKVRSFLSAYYKEEMPLDKREMVKAHLDHCPSCRRELQAFNAIDQMVKELPSLKASENFNAVLLRRVGSENFAEKRNPAYLPGRIPRFSTAKLAIASVTAVIVLAFGVSLNFTGSLFRSSSPQMAIVTAVPDNDRYLTVQPTNNPLLNQHKSVSRMVEQYNRWREYSRSLRPNAAVEQLRGNVAIMASSAGESRFLGDSGFQVRPVVRDYLIVPRDQTTAAERVAY